MTDNERESRYAEAMRRADNEVVEATNFGRLTATYYETARAVMAVADEEQADLRAEVKRLREDADIVEADLREVEADARAQRARAESAEARLNALVADLRGLADEWERVAWVDIPEPRAVLDKHAGEQ